MKIVSIAVLALVALSATACINLRSDYMDITYYRLNQEKPKYPNIGSAEGVLQIRDLEIAEELDTERMLALRNEIEVEKYHYHRWIVDAGALATDFLVERFNNLSAFEGGVIGPSSILVPDYIMEGKLLEMIARNADPRSDFKNSVYLSLKVAIIKRYPLESRTDIVLNKVYTKSVERPSDAVETIAPAFSKALSAIADEIMFDVQSAASRHDMQQEKIEE